MDLTRENQRDIIAGMKSAIDFHDRFPMECLRGFDSMSRVQRRKQLDRMRRLVAKLEGLNDTGAGVCPPFKAPVKGIGGLL